MNLYDKDPRAKKLFFGTRTICTNEKLWYPTRRESDDLYIHILDQVFPLLVATGFFEKTKFDRLSIHFRMVDSTEINHKITSRLHGQDTCQIAIDFHPSEFEERVKTDYFIFALSNIATALNFICEQFELDNSAVTDFAERFEKTYGQQMYTITEEKNLSKEDNSIGGALAPAPIAYVSESNIDRHFSNEELLFPAFDMHRWCVSAPFTPENLAKIGPDTKYVYILPDIQEESCRNLAEVMKTVPQVALRIDRYNDKTNRDILAHFKDIKRVSIRFSNVDDFGGLRLLSRDLVRLELDYGNATGTPRFSELEHFTALQLLRIEGNGFDAAKLPGLITLQGLCLAESDINVDSICALSNLRSLVVLDSQVQSLKGLPDLQRLQHLALCTMPKLTSLLEIEELSNLEFLQLISLKKIGTLPELGKLSKLRRLNLERLKNLKDLAPIIQCQTLEVLLLNEMDHLKPKDVECLLNHASLKGLRTDNLPLEKTLKLPRLGTSSVYDFGQNQR